MTRPFPLAVAQLLIKRIPPFRATANSDTTTVTPILNTHTDARFALGNQQDPVLILGLVPRRAPRRTSRGFAVLLLPLDAQLFEYTR